MNSLGLPFLNPTDTGFKKEKVLFPQSSMC